ncbi:MAG: TetR/AcrR family transcriptional regulator, partial [Myxococcota bacterium]
DGALECLAEYGYSGTTTSLIAGRAGVSRGALLHQFPTRQALVIEAVVHLAKRRLEDARRDAAALPESDHRLDAAIELLWQSFSGPLFYAALELWVAARTDAELHKALYAAERDIGRAIGSLVGTLGGAAAQAAGFDDLIELTLHMLRGMSLQRILRDDDEERRRHFDLWKGLFIQHLKMGEKK